MPPAANFPPAILLMGPTASGKTDVALHLARRFPVELISVDSAQVFRDMNIGTAKPDAATLAEFPHHLIDLISPEDAYSAARFRREALALMGEIRARGKLPLLVGGTMLYFKALLEGLAELPAACPAIRAEIGAQAARYGWPWVHAELARVDPSSAARLHPTDAQRLQRRWRFTGWLENRCRCCWPKRRRSLLAGIFCHWGCCLPIALFCMNVLPGALMPCWPLVWRMNLSACAAIIN